MGKTVISLFQSEAEASGVVRRLEELGISSGDIRVFTHGATNRSGPSDRASGEGLRGPDQVAEYLERENVPRDDARAYAEGVRRGHALVAVRCDDDQVDEVVRILDNEGTLDL